MDGIFDTLENHRLKMYFYTIILVFIVKINVIADK